MLTIATPTALAKRKHYQPRTGREILETMIVISDAVEQLLLHDPHSKIHRWPIQNRDYPGLELKDDLREILERLNLLPQNDDLQRPYWSYPKDHTVSADELRQLHHTLTIINDTAFEQALREEQLYACTFHLEFSINQSPAHYYPFPRSHLSDLGLPDNLDKIVVRCLHKQAELSGLYNSEKAGQEILSHLLPHKVNPTHTSVTVLNSESDVFTHKHRYFFIPKQSKPSSYDTTHLDLVLGAGIRDSQGTPLAYLIFKHTDQPEIPLLTP